MFPFADIVRANDQSAKRLIWLASTISGEGADWVWEWRDGGRVAFSFKHLNDLETFCTKRLLIGL